MGVAAVGILCGAVMSNGMMDVARHGIFRPEQFYFQDIMCICLAVMAIDVILLDTFNTLGLPTSTTVSIVFELLGGAFALAMVKLAADDTGLTFADMLNSEKALSVIMAIFLSVAIAFVFGAVVQYIARLIFTFNYKSHMKWSAALFGGVAMTAIIYFILIKGMKDSSFMTPELSEWISTIPVIWWPVVSFSSAFSRRCFTGVGSIFSRWSRCWELSPWRWPSPETTW